MKKTVCIVTPFFTDPFGSKRINYGDGFILSAIKKIIGDDYQFCMISSRKKIDLYDIELINKNFACIILAGTNWVGKEFNIFTGLTYEMCEKIKIPIIPFGVGRGDINNFEDINPNGRNILNYIMKSSGIASVRCKDTARIINQSNQNSNIFITGCPVLHVPLISSSSICKKENILISVTNRVDHYKDEMSNLIEIRRLYPNKNLCLYFQQSRSKPKNFKNGYKNLIRDKDEAGFDKLIMIAKRMNYKVEIPSSTEECYALFDDYELHIGTRLHVHLTYRAAGRKSILLSVDNRAIDYKNTFEDPGVYEGSRFQMDMEFTNFYLNEIIINEMNNFKIKFHEKFS